ncbi:MAG: peptide deformylase [Ardenticatenaceae bacterium]
MARRKIYKLPKDEKKLRQKSEPVGKVTRRVRRLVKDLADTLNEADGVGLSAPQIGIHQRVAMVVIGLKPDGERVHEDQEPFMLPLIDPEIMEAGKIERSYDGCLSIPGLQGYTNRPEMLRVQTLDMDNNLIEYDFEGFEARIVHHEIDHLDGILYFDRLSSLEELYYLVEAEEEDKVEFVPYLNVHPKFRFMPWRRKGLPTRGIKTIADK